MDTVKVRASSIGVFFSCPLRWYITNILKKTLPSTAPAAIGTAVHKSTATYDASRLEDNKARWLTIDDSAEEILQHFADPGEEIDWEGMPLDTAVERAVGVHMRYCGEIAHTHQYTHVENTFDTMSIECEVDTGSIRLDLSGTVDRVFQRDGKFGVADIKTGAAALSQSSGKHKAQLAAYEMLAEENLGILIEESGELIKLQTSSNFKVGVENVSNAREALLGNDDFPGMLMHMARALKSGDFYGNPNSWLCSEKYCPHFSRCIYK